MTNDRRHASTDKEVIIHTVEIPQPAVKPVAVPKPAAAEAAPSKTDTVTTVEKEEVKSSIIA
jgi:hypothetical protein